MLLCVTNHFVAYNSQNINDKTMFRLIQRYLSRKTVKESIRGEENVSRDFIRAVIDALITTGNQMAQCNLSGCGNNSIEGSVTIASLRVGITSDHYSDYMVGDTFDIYFHAHDITHTLGKADARRLLDYAIPIITEREETIYKQRVEATKASTQTLKNVNA